MRKMSAVLVALILAIAIPAMAAEELGNCLVEFPLGYDRPGIDKQLTPENRLKIKWIAYVLEYHAIKEGERHFPGGKDLESREAFSKAMKAASLDENKVYLLKARMFVTAQNPTRGYWWFAYIDKNELRLTQ